MTHKIGLKFYLEAGEDTEPETWFRVFNTWVPDTPEEVLVDVADYSHFSEGPVTLLIGHEANYSIDRTENRTGLLYNRKQPLGGSFGSSLTSALRAALTACRRLEEEPSLEGQIRFLGEEVQLTLNDRLNAPNTDETLAAIRNDLDEVMGRLYGGMEFEVVRGPEGKDRFSVAIKAKEPFEISSLLENFDR